MRDRPRWWGYVIHVIQDYPELHAKLIGLRETNITANYTGLTGSSGLSDPIYNAVTKSLPRRDQIEHDAVETAIAWVMTRPNSRQRMMLITMVYLRRTHTLEGAALAVGYVYGHAKRLNQEFVREVAKNLELTD